MTRTPSPPLPGSLNPDQVLLKATYWILDLVGQNYEALVIVWLQKQTVADHRL